ncbi:CASP-like protein 1E1 [Dioscorea cayenensis subsp. rotundata]|uniref:CASP-like protein n=1 Tax=Dioscorea cayennensis subsp. rotundata TaxID=55577 RepID=A0AB40BRK5_DIOCR|nr:CASP-like protein 1E1 [Dioscorea cayenensis subsp. rotundata]
MEASAQAPTQAQVHSIGSPMETETKVYSATRPVAASSNSTQLLGFIIRILAVKLTFVATIVMGVAKQTVKVDNSDLGDYDGGYTWVTVKSTYNSSLVYFIVVNTLAFIYSTFSLALSIANRTNFTNLQVFISIADLIMLIFLFSTNGAAAAVAIILEKGDAHLGILKICGYVGTFCGHITASIVLSMIASLAYALLVLLAIVSLRNSFL